MALRVRAGSWRRMADLGAERARDRLVGFDVGAADQVDAVGHCGEDAVHARRAVRGLEPFERFGDRLRLSRQVEDQGRVRCAVERDLAQHADLARQDRRRHELERDAAHLFAEARHRARRDREGRLRRHVAPRRPGAAGGQHEIAADAVDELDQRALDRRPFVGDQALVRLPRRGQRARQPVAQCRAGPCPRRRRCEARSDTDTRPTIRSSALRRCAARAHWTTLRATRCGMSASGRPGALMQAPAGDRARARTAPASARWRVRLVRSRRAARTSAAQLLHVELHGCSATSSVSAASSASSRSRQASA